MPSISIKMTDKTMQNAEIGIKNNFTEGKVSGIITRLALPLIVAEFVNILYNLVDRMYIGHIPDVGTAALTGLGLVFPIVTLLNAFSNLCGYGGMPLCSIARGEKRDKDAEQIMSTAFTMLVAIALLLTTVCLLFADKLLLVMGADGETLPYALDYLRIYLIGTVFVMIGLGMTPFITGQGFSKVSMRTTVFGACLNIILDPILIYWFDLGVRGAAIATVISQCCIAVWVISFLTGKKAILKLRLFVFEGKYFKQILSLGVSGFTFKMTNSVTQAIVNSVLHTFGGALSTLYIGSMSIINSIREVISLPTNGLTNAFQPVLGYNYGAKRFDRAKKCISFVTLTASVYNVICWLILMIVPQFLIRIFTADEQLIKICVTCMRIYFSVYFLMTMQLVGQQTFVALNHPRKAVFFSMLRKAVLIIPLTLLLPRIGFGVKGVFIAESISQLVGASLCYLTMQLTIVRELNSRIADG